VSTATAAEPIRIRNYQPGDEPAQVEIYNVATQDLPGFKAATVEEVIRRFRATDFDPQTKLYAEQAGEIVGYVSFSQNGRVSVPWCRPDAVAARTPLMDAAIAAMKLRGLKQAWAAYHGDWDGVRWLLESFGFRVVREIVNFVAPVGQLPRDPMSPPFRIEALNRDDVQEVYRLAPAAFAVESAADLAVAWFDGPYFSSEAVFSVRDATNSSIAGVGIAVTNPKYADATKIDAAMPCFRLGALRTESERTKRVNGLFSYVARPGPDNHHLARLLISEACSRFELAGLAHVAAQCPSDRELELAFYRSCFQVQKSFPVFVREL